MNNSSEVRVPWNVRHVLLNSVWGTKIPSVLDYTSNRYTVTCVTFLVRSQHLPPEFSLGTPLGLLSDIRKPFSGHKNSTSILHSARDFLSNFKSLLQPPHSVCTPVGLVSVPTLFRFTYRLLLGQRNKETSVSKTFLNPIGDSLRTFGISI